MSVSTKSFATMVSDFAVAVQGSSSKLINFTKGAVLRATAEATASVSLWLQGTILQVLALTRAASSNGSDLDTWFAQFNFTRLPADAATTQETFSRYTPTNSALVQVGALVQTADGTVQFTVVADTTNPAYSASQGGYVIPAGQASVTAAVQCTVAGAAGNVAAGALNSLGTGINGVDYVSNASAVVNGSDAETDTAARTRFVLFIASLEAATLLAVKNAVAAVQSGMTAIIAENTQYNGQTQAGYFTAIVNDGSGAATSTEIANASTAIEAVRPLTVTYGVHAPTPVQVIISMSITVDTGYTKSAVAALVQAAVNAYVASIATTEAGATLPYTNVATQAYGVDGVTNVSNVLVNGGTADLTIGYQGAFQASTVTVN
jgi:hypothetical protein